MIDPSAKVFHYGQAIFEGMKAYKDEMMIFGYLDQTKIFNRFNKSATRMAMPEVPEEVFMDGLKQLLKLEKDWVKKGKGNTLYIKTFYDCNW